MTKNDLLKYIKGVFDTEINIYVQENALNDMYKTYDGLATGIRVKMPEMRENNVSILDSVILSAKITAVVVGSICAIIMLIGDENIFLRLLTAVFTFFTGGAMGFAGGIVIGGIIGIIRKLLRYKRLADIYESDLSEYYNELERDNLRLSIEKKKQERLEKEIEVMKSQLSVSRQNLKKMYSYNIIHPDYRNINAIGTIYGYLSKGMTHSLQFDTATGDKGAYNIYEKEKRLDRIITNTDEILNRLEEISSSQYELAHELQNANAQISRLHDGFNRFAVATENNINELKAIESVTAYNTDCIRRQTEIMNWLTIMRY